MSSGGMMCISSFMVCCSGIQVILKCCLNNLRDCNICIIDDWNLWNMLFRLPQVSWYTYQVSWGLVQEFKQYWSYYCNNLRDCNVCIIEERNLWSMLFRLPQVSWYTYQVSWGLVQEFKQYWSYYCNNLRGCNVGITDGLTDLWSTPFRLAQMPWSPYRVLQDWFRHSKFDSRGYTDTEGARWFNKLTRSFLIRKVDWNGK
jgi:hypothetical protein